jgi:hypothetical protein
MDAQPAHGALSNPNISYPLTFNKRKFKLAVILV